MHRFYCPETFSSGGSVALSRDESSHLARVLRLEEGAEVQLFDGKGSVARAHVLIASGSKSVVKIESVEAAIHRPRIRLVFAISKSQALDFIIHRATEVGVAGLTPIVTKHSLEKKFFNKERWDKVAIEVCKQCQISFVPEIVEPQSLQSWLQNRNKSTTLLFCDEEKRDEKPPFLPAEGEIEILLGAEGGWSGDERKAVLEASAIPLSLGPARLRAETAALVAVVLAKKAIGEIP